MATITEDYVSFEIAKLLKDKGFDAPCRSYYTDYEDYIDFSYCNDELTDLQMGVWETLRPTLQMAMKWLREKHLLHISIDMMNGGRWEYEIDDISVPFVLPKYYCDKTFSNYEKAADDAIKYCLENLI